MFVVFGDGWKSILSVVFLLRQWGCKDDWTKEEADKRLKMGGGVVGVNPRCQGRFVIRDERIIPTKVPLTCVVVPRRPGPAVTDPPLCSLCCRWEEEVSKREQLESTVESMQQVGKHKQ